MIYSLWLLGLSVLFIGLERLWPRRPQPLLRRGIWTDIAYVIFNGEYLGVLIGALATRVTAVVDLPPVLHQNAMAGFGFWPQFLVLLLVFDFAQW